MAYTTWRFSLSEMSSGEGLACKLAFSHSGRTGEKVEDYFRTLEESTTVLPKGNHRSTYD